MMFDDAELEAMKKMEYGTTLDSRAETHIVYGLEAIGMCHVWIYRF